MPWSASIPLVLGLVFNLFLIPLARRLGFKLGRVAMPREDRWHKQPTPTLGGVGIFLSFGVALVISQWLFRSGDPTRWSFLGGSAILFFVGLYDEFRPMTPIAKLVAQILAATFVIALGYTSTFFTPRISNAILAQLPNILFTYAWLVGITNAINLLDNMDGLAGGISLITAAILGYFFWRDGNISLLWISLALVGSLLGFLVFNFPPAKIFMGDSGSLFLGFTLAGLAIAQQQQASNVFAVIAVPTLVFMLPILDTALVMVTRLMRGQSPVQGGRDHTSHRLVAFGLSERQALFVLYGVALFSAVMAASLESINYWMSLVLAPILVLGLALLAAYLGRLKVIPASAPSRSGQTIARLMTSLTYRQRIPELILDFFLIGITYYLAFLAGYTLQLNQLRLGIYLSSLPLAVASAYLSFYFFGIYRVVWRYASFDDLIRYLQASLGGIALFAAAVFVLDSVDLTPWTANFVHRILAFYGVFLFIGLAITRSSFRFLDALLQQRTRPDETPILIAGAGDTGDLVLRWILMNPDLKYRPVGFLDRDPLLAGRYVHGVKVLGGVDDLPALLDRHHIAGLVLAEDDLEQVWGERLDQICRERNCWVRKLRFEIELVSCV